MRRIERLLRDDPDMQAELARVEESLRPLEDGLDSVDVPPADLVSRTMAMLPPLPPPAASQSVQQDNSANLGGNQDELDASVQLPSMRDGVEPAREQSWSWMDWSVSAIAGAVVLGLLLPTLAEGRFEARKNACQDQLRQFGTAITQYVSRDSQERLPAVASDGPEAFAGVYAVRLKEAGLLPDESIRWCPSLDRPESPRGDGASTVVGVEMVRVGSVDQLHQATVNELRQLQRSIGGHYAYTLGVIENEKLAPPKFEGRSAFAIMSDAPLSGSPVGIITSEKIGHGGRGINLLFEDGRVQFVPLESLDQVVDHPLLNHRGEAEAGVNIDDASLAPSWCSPFLTGKQR